MKKALLLIILLMPVLCYSQETKKLSVDSVYRDVKDGFYKLVNTLEGPAKHTYVIYVRQQFIHGISVAILIVGLFIISTSLLFISRKKSKWIMDEDVPDAWAVCTVMCAVALIALVIATSVVAPDTATQIFNPEYFAIQEIIKTIK